MREKFDKTVKNLKKRKATKINGIQIEYWEKFKKKMKMNQLKLLKIYIRNRGASNKLCKVFILILNKTVAKKCEKFLTIKLLSHASKILTKIIFQYMKVKIKQILSGDQFGFRKNVDTREQFWLYG